MPEPVAAKTFSPGAALPTWKSLASAAGLLALASIAESLLNGSSSVAGGMTILWISNGLLMGILLCASRRHWPAYLALGYLLDCAASTLTGSAFSSALVFSLCNLVEIALGALLLRNTLTIHPDLSRRKQLKHFVLYGLGVAPCVASLLASLYLVHLRGVNFPKQFRDWYIADAIGIAIITPLYLSFHRGGRIASTPLREIVALFGLLASVLLLVFGQTRFPLLFLILPFLLLLGVRLRLAGSALGLLLVAFAGGWFTVAGRGPIGLVPHSSMVERVLLLQFFVSACMLMLCVTEVVISEQAKLQDHLAESEARFRLLAEASRDVIVLSRLDGTRKYVSPAVTEMLGWEPAELVDDDFKRIVHPDDVPLLEGMFAACRDGQPSSAFSYRCRTRGGDYLWMEAHLRLYKDSAGEPAGYVNVVRDVSSRKAEEERLQSAYRLAEDLAASDALTGIANRRRLDSTLEGEWRRASRGRLPISLLLMDVDHFKLYNDLYGHVHGDNCLRQIAAIAQAIVQRPGDLLARYGGEEFAVVLPSTDAPGAFAIAEQIRIAVLALNLSHRANPHGVVSVSLGCATAVPERDSPCELLVHAADNALYFAKAAGRNRTETNSETMYTPRRASGSRLVLP